MDMYGPVRTIGQNLKSWGLSGSKSAAKPASKPVVAESKQAAKPAHKAVAAPAKKVESKPVAPKSRIDALLEQVETITKEMKTVFSEVPSPKIRSVVESLEHIQKVSASVVKKYGWRMEERSKTITELFKALNGKAEELRQAVFGGSLSEESEVRSDANELLKRFVKAVGIVREDLGISEDIFKGLVQEASKIQ
jgi:hypothetical protein